METFLWLGGAFAEQPVLIWPALLAGGWIVGGLGNWAADHLPYWSAPPSEAQASEPLPTPPARPGRYWPPPWSAQAGRRARWLPIATGLLFVAGAWRFEGQPGAQGLFSLFGAFLLAVLVIDLEQRRVLNVMMLPAALVALGVGLLPFSPPILAVLLGGALNLAVFLGVYLVGRGRMGMGDVKLAGVIGLMVGHPASWTALVTGILLGGVGALWLLIAQRGTLQSTIAYAPYLAVGALIAMWIAWV